MRRLAEIEEGVALRLEVPVHENAMVSSLSREAADQRVFAAVTVTCEIGEGTVRLGHRFVVLSDPPAHFRNQPPPECSRASQNGRRVAILTLQVISDLAGEGVRVL